jgi:Tripartite tricarboxylate transporter TctB family
VTLIDKNVIGAAVLLACTAAAFFELTRFPAEARPFPALVLVVLLVTGLIWLVRSLLVQASPGNDPVTTGGKRRLIAAVGLTFAYAVAVSHLSYFIPTLLYIPAMAIVLGNRQPLVVGLVGVGFTVGAYLIFVVIFERPIPLL